MQKRVKAKAIPITACSICYNIIIWSTYPLKPSLFQILGNPSLKVLAKPGMVWILTLTASIGQSAISAKNSADAEAARYSDVLHKKAFS